MNIREEFSAALSNEFGAKNVESRLLDELMVIMNKAFSELENRKYASQYALEVASKLPLQNENEVLEAAVKYRKFLLDIK